MKKSMVKFFSVLLALVLAVSVTPVAALASAAAHTHDYVQCGFGTDISLYDDEYHRVIKYTDYSCSCGNSYSELNLDYKEKHTPMVGSKVYLGSYVGENDLIYSTYQYTCIDCKGDYYKDVEGKSSEFTSLNAEIFAE